ncbi:putative nephrin, partial [Operophtera brumata]
PPTFRTRPQNIEADIGSSVTLSCDVDGQPPPEIRWLLHEPGRIGNLLQRTVSEAINEDLSEGDYQRQKQKKLILKMFLGPPKILSNRTQFGSEGDSARIECIALSVPKPDDIRWYFEGKEISVIYDPDYATLDETLSDGSIKSSLVIRASQSRHYGLYNCSITNEYGNANDGIDYTSSERSDSKLPAGLPLAGPVGLPSHMRHDDPRLQFRYSNDYSDPAYNDAYFKQPPAAYIYDYPQGYAPPPNLRSASNSLQRTKTDETDAINNLGLPVGGDNTPPTPIYAQPHNKNQGVDLRYAATYGNPYLRNSSLGYGVHTAKPAATPAPPPYSARGSVVLPS